jgi:hypothetical protein
MILPYKVAIKARRDPVGEDFLAKFEFSPEELKSWLSEYVAAQPAEALRLLASMHAEAIIALSAKKVVGGDAA